MYQSNIETCVSCKNIGQISIWMILIVSKCSIYHVKIPIFSSIFRGPQTPHTSTNFQEIFVNENACHILGTICEPFRIPKTYHINRFKTYVEILSSFELQVKKCTASHFFLFLICTDIQY